LDLLRRHKTSTKNWPMWLVSSADALHSPPPPGNATEELRQLKDLTNRRTAADLDLIAWWDVGGPVYRWNQIASAELLDHGVNTLMATRNLALLHAAIQDATVIAWTTKDVHRRPRPSQLDPTLTAALPVPPSPSYPSDFAAATTAAVEVLTYLFPDRADVLRGKAEEAMRSRQLAGIEFPSDAAAGREIGAAVAARAIERAKTDGSDRKWTGTVPEGPGKWQGKNPVNPAIATWKTWVLAAPDALRPPPPPDSAAAARSPVQVAISAAQSPELSGCPWLPVHRRCSHAGAPLSARCRSTSCTWQAGCGGTHLRRDPLPFGHQRWPSDWPRCCRTSDDAHIGVGPMTRDRPYSATSSLPATMSMRLLAIALFRA
jgi:membrane-associated phospholipid phosphatase